MSKPSQLDKRERAHYCIMACTKILSEIATDNDNEDGNEIPPEINNGFVIGGLLEAINLANDVLVTKSHR
jgi:hypothetical protein